MKIKTGFTVDMGVFYRTPSGKIPARIVRVNPVVNGDYSEEYVITVTSSRYGTYRKGDTFTTSGNFLTVRSRPITPERKAMMQRKATERKAMEALKNMKGKLTR